MPMRPKTPCNRPGCPALTDGRYCQAHEQDDKQLDRERKHQADKNRPNSSQRGYTSRWQKARVHWLRQHPLCVHCQKEGRITAAREVDHIVSHKGDTGLFWNEDNWQSLCKPCHSTKTATEDGGFG